MSWNLNKWSYYTWNIFLKWCLDNWPLDNYHPGNCPLDDYCLPDYCPQNCPQIILPDNPLNALNYCPWINAPGLIPEIIAPWQYPPGNCSRGKLYFGWFVVYIIPHLTNGSRENYQIDTEKVYHQKTHEILFKKK